MIEENGDRTFIGSKNGSVRQLDIDDIKIDDDCEIVSYASLFISPKLNDDKLSILFKDIKDKGKTLCVDTSTPKNNETINELSCLQYIDYFFCNESEAKSLTNKDNIFDIEDELYKSGIKTVIIKCGSKGAFYKGKYCEPIYIDNVVDTTGAGDSFVAGFIKGLQDNLTFEECINNANRFGSNACLYVGGTQWINHI